MTHQEVLAKWIGRNYIESGMQKGECVAWSKVYIKERGYPIKGFGGSAWNGWVTGIPFDKTWKKVIKTPLNYPKEGDILFWAEKRCKYGHTAVANRLCNPMVLRYSDQNGTGKGDKIQNRFGTYSNVVGWFTKI